MFPEYTYLDSFALLFTEIMDASCWILRIPNLIIRVNGRLKLKTCSLILSVRVFFCSTDLFLHSESALIICTKERKKKSKLNLHQFGYTERKIMLAHTYSLYQISIIYCIVILFLIYIIHILYVRNVEEISSRIANRWFGIKMPVYQCKLY